MPRTAMKMTYLERWAIYAIIAIYTALNVPLLVAKVGTCQQIGVFSIDEETLCKTARNMVASGSFTSADVNPYPYGQLYPVLIGAPLLLLKAVTNCSETMAIRWAVVLLILSGATVLAMTYRVCARLYPWPYAPLAATLLLTVPKFWRWSNEIHPDLPQLAFLMMGFYFSVRLYETPLPAARQRLKHLSLASLCAGLAMATKFNGVFLLPVILVAYNRPFALGWQTLRVRDVVIENVKCGVLCAMLFATAFFFFNPYFVFNHGAVSEPFVRAAGFARGEAVGYSIAERLVNILYSNYNMASLVVGGVYVVCVCGVLYGLGSLLLRYAKEIRAPKILSEVFVVVFLAYSLGVGYGLVNGKLLRGYERYLLPAVPLLFISAMRIVSLMVSTDRLPSIASIGLVASLVLVGQNGLMHRCYGEYVNRYLQKEAGNFKVYEWVQKNVPDRSLIYTENYIYVPGSEEPCKPRHGTSPCYQIVRDYAVRSEWVMRLSDYVITKTLRYSIYSDPERWQHYGDVSMRKSRLLYRSLERDALPGFKRVAVLGRGGEDLVAVYKNVGRHRPLQPEARAYIANAVNH